MDAHEIFCMFGNNFFVSLEHFMPWIQRTLVKQTLNTNIQKLLVFLLMTTVFTNGILLKGVLEDDKFYIRTMSVVDAALVIMFFTPVTTRMLCRIRHKAMTAIIIVVIFLFKVVADTLIFISTFIKKLDRHAKPNLIIASSVFGATACGGILIIWIVLCAEGVILKSRVNDGNGNGYENLIKENGTLSQSNKNTQTNEEEEY